MSEENTTESSTTEAQAEAPAEKKTRKSSGPRKQRPVQVVASVVDGRVHVYVATKDELTAAKALTTAIRNGDRGVESFTVELV